MSLGGRVFVNQRGALEVDRASLHASAGYARQIVALEALEQAMRSKPETNGKGMAETKPAGYSQKYDAYFDPNTREWLEPRCRDRGCEFCKDRPEKAP